MSKEAALKFLTEKLAALQVIKQELRRLSGSIVDLDQLDDVNNELARVNEMLFALESARNSLEATENEVPPVPEERVEALTDALRRLDVFVRSDQNIHTALAVLTQLADVIRSA